MKLLVLIPLLLMSLNSFSGDCKPQQENHNFSNKMLSSKDRVLNLPGFGCVKDFELAGTLPIIDDHYTTNKERPNLFYWFVESRNHKANSPIVLWLNGGPGAASTYGFFMENGPYIATENNGLIEREHAWTNQANYLVIDQPAGVGLSYANKDTYANESEAMDQLYHALLAFFKRYPELRKRPFFLAGESYAGKYIPQLSMRILAKKPSNQTINFQGVLIGDGWVNPRLQQSTNADFAYSHGLIDKRVYKKVTALYQQCAHEIDKASPSSRRANQICSQIQLLIQKESGGLNLANHHTGKEQSDALMISYLNRVDVRKALHVAPSVPLYTTFSSMVADRLEVGEHDSVANLFATLLEKRIRVMIYNGLYDAKDSNFMGTDQWLAALIWPDSKAFANASTCPWRINKKVVGYVKTAAGLTQIKIRKAGHLAPADQPEVLLNLLNQFLRDKPFC